MHVQIDKCTIRITEQSLKEIKGLVDKWKEGHPNSEEVKIESDYSRVSFLVVLETQPNTQESLGFQIYG